MRKATGLKLVGGYSFGSNQADAEETFQNFSKIRVIEKDTRLPDWCIFRMQRMLVKKLEELPINQAIIYELIPGISLLLSEVEEIVERFPLGQFRLLPRIKACEICRVKDPAWTPKIK